MTDGFVRASELAGGDGPTWTPGPAFVAMFDDDAAEVTIFPDVECSEMYTQWVTIDAEHAIPEGEWR